MGLIMRFYTSCLVLSVTLSSH